MKSPAERIAGRLIGLAAGDCLGAPIEFGEIRVRPRQEWATEITGGGAFDWRPGQGTDDSDLTWAVTKAYFDPPPRCRPERLQVRIGSRAD
jgi:ADP-ribosyl-[dinitrogen reductase] hydrolase